MASCNESMPPFTMYPPFFSTFTTPQPFRLLSSSELDQILLQPNSLNHHEQQRRNFSCGDPKNCGRKPQTRTPPTGGSSSRGNSTLLGRGTPPNGGSSSHGNASPMGRGTPPTGGNNSRGNSSPRGRARGVVSPSGMGIPGQSAFTRYTSPSSGGSGFMQRAQAVVVHAGGSNSSAPAAGLQLGLAAVRKRNRESGINPPAPVLGAQNPVQCSVCRREFLTPKALFGHMRSHPERGWKGAHPPPTFRAEEEFADLRVQNAAPPEEGGEAENEEQHNYKVPDLNNPPPPDDFEN